ncbi:helix-turn-helix domain-containing protein [Parafrankia discariae]|uniref:helix-turn-helix domain-containing protein n=1 Tax=Parafrankia discariae TaxID=365528 RepID=UPI00037799F1|nr:MerR family transcriptional regulator [Parafrankia discariae]
MNSTIDDEDLAAAETRSDAETRSAPEPGGPVRGGPALTGPAPQAPAPGATAPDGSDPEAPGPTTPAAESGLYAIGQAARELGVSVRSLRYYQEVGLLTPSGRTTGGNRLYADADLARVRRIRELQELLGFNLDEIRIMLGHEDRLARVRVDYRASSDAVERAQLLDDAEEAYTQLRDEIDEKIGRLAAFRAEMNGHLERVALARAELTE